MSHIRLLNLFKRYDDGTQALSDLSLECRDGEFVVIFGQPGAGKTTTLKIIAGIEEPSSGDVCFGDQRVNDVPPEERDVTMAFEAYALYPHMTVRETLEFPLRAPGRNFADEERQRRVLQVAELLEIDSLLDRRPHQLSGGQRQRISLGRALVRTGHVTLLDEPIAHLDARLRHMLRGELKHFQRERGATTIYTTPDYSEAAGIADRVAVLVAGELRQFAPPEEIYYEPVDLDVALMAGDPKMNIFDISPEGPYIDANGSSVPVPALSAETRYVGIRPINLNISLEPLDRAISGEVYVAEPVGYDQIVRVQVGSRVINIQAPLTEGVFRIGEKVWLMPEWERSYHFDAAGQRRGGEG